jgi:hypothetical protein
MDGHVASYTRHCNMGFQCQAFMVEDGCQPHSRCDDDAKGRTFGCGLEVLENQLPNSSS